MAASNSAPDQVVEYVGHKIACVRWRPTPSGSLEEPVHFVSGSWDDEVSGLCLCSGFSQIEAILVVVAEPGVLMEDRES